MRDRIIIGPFSSFAQPVVDLGVQALLRQNENYSQKTGMGSSHPFFLLHSWKGLLRTRSSLSKECIPQNGLFVTSTVQLTQSTVMYKYRLILQMLSSLPEFITFM